MVLSSLLYGSSGLCSSVTISILVLRLLSFWVFFRRFLEASACSLNFYLCVCIFGVFLLLYSTTNYGIRFNHKSSISFVRFFFFSQVFNVTSCKVSCFFQKGLNSWFLLNTFGLIIYLRWQRLRVFPTQGPCFWGNNGIFLSTPCWASNAKVVTGGQLSKWGPSPWAYGH
jgi:hypothetical protein